jgi:low affinity Fe/Cu permease
LYTEKIIPCGNNDRNKVYSTKLPIKQQSRDAKAVQIKLDELIRAIDAARNEVIDVEDSLEQDLNKLRQDFSELGNNFKE